MTILASAQFRFATGGSTHSFEKLVVEDENGSFRLVPPFGSVCLPGVPPMECPKIKEAVRRELEEIRKIDPHAEAKITGVLRCE